MPQSPWRDGFRLFCSNRLPPGKPGGGTRDSHECFTRLSLGSDDSGPSHSSRPLQITGLPDASAPSHDTRLAHARLGYISTRHYRPATAGMASGKVRKVIRNEASGLMMDDGLLMILNRRRSVQLLLSQRFISVHPRSSAVSFALCPWWPPWWNLLFLAARPRRWWAQPTLPLSPRLCKSFPHTGLSHSICGRKKLLPRRDFDLTPKGRHCMVISERTIYF